MTKGKLIVFEGISGTGKETQAKLLTDYLFEQGVSAHIVYHPSPDVKLLLSGWRKERHIDHMTEVYLLLADRYDRVRQRIEPALDRGEWVISLRNYISALVYQGKTERDRRFIREQFGRFDPPADFLFFFDIDPQRAYERVLERNEQTGESLGTYEALDTLKEMGERYRRIFAKIAHIAVRAGSSTQGVHGQIRQHVVVHDKNVNG